MTWILERWVAAHVLLALVLLLGRLLSRWRALGPAAALWTTRALVVAAIALPFVPAPQAKVDFRAPVQVWSSPSRGHGESARVQQGPVARAFGATVGESSLRTGALVVAVGAMALACVRIARAWRGVVRSLDGSRTLHRAGSVELKISDHARTPFAVRVRGRAVVVLDSATFARRADRILAARHELQHHRQGDTLLALPLVALLAPFAPTGLAFAMEGLLREMEEHACDDALVRSGRVSVRNYGSCLLRIAGQSGPPRLATAWLSPRASLLKRRILTMTDRTPRISRGAALLAGAGALAILFAAACASHELVADHRVSKEQVAEVAARASAPGFTVTADPIVVEEVNRLLATPDGRRFAKSAIERKPRYEAKIASALAAGNLPAHLMAVPLVESGYENQGPSGKIESMAPGTAGAGIWMFIPATAREYGLRVDETADERLDVDRETGAAIRLFSDLYAEFGDWALALAAYNQGAKHVRKAIAETGTRDAFELMRKNAINHYAAQVMAAAIVLQDPQL